MEFFGDNAALPVCLGIATGLLAALFLGSWFRLLGTLRARRSPGGADGAAPAARGGPLAALLHPAPWAVLVAGPYAAYRYAWLQPSTGSIRFVAATAVTVVLWLLFILIVDLKARRP